MSLLRRFLGVLVLLISTACFIVCIAGIAGIWMAYQDLSERTRKITARLEVGLERAAVANRDVGRALEKARDDVARLDKERIDLPAGEKSSRPPDNLRRLVWQEIGRRLNELGGRLATVSDAAAVVSSLLQSLQELPLSQSGRIDPERLERLTDRASQLSVSLQRLQAMLGDGDRAVADKEIATATREVDLALRKCQTIVDEWQSDLDTACAELPRFEAEILGWMTVVAFAVTVVCVWLALSQISLFARALKWCRSKPRKEPGRAAAAAGAAGGAAGVQKPGTHI